MSLDYSLHVEERCDHCGHVIGIRKVCDCIMSLDYSLHVEERCDHCGHVIGTRKVCDLNVTHTLGKIARRVGIYPFLWRAPEFGIERAEQLIKPLEYSLDYMRNNRELLLPLEPENGWGTLSDFIEFCANLLKVAKEYPQATIRSDR